MKTQEAERITMGREAAGMTQAQLAKAVKWRQPKMSKIERGNMIPSAEDLRALRSVIDIPDGPPPLYAETMSLHGIPSVTPEKPIKRLLAELNMRRMEWSPQLSSELPFLPPSVANMSPAQIAGKSRGIAYELFVEDVNFNAPVPAVSFRHPTVIFVNSRLGPYQRRFAVAHELGHLMMHDVPYKGMNDEADEFAHELLLPMKDLMREVKGEIDPAWLAEMSNKFRTPAVVLLKRLRIFSKSHAAYLKLRLRQQGLNHYENIYY